MCKRLDALLCLVILIFMWACGAAPAVSNSNVNIGSNTYYPNTNVNIDPNNLPPGISNGPVLPSGNSTPGIPANPMILPKGATPTPGIPSPAELKKGLKHGVTPTPGIPDAETLRRQMNGLQNINAPLPGNTDPKPRKTPPKPPGER